MTAPANRWKLGLFVVAGTAVALGGLAWLGAHELERASHPVLAYFDEALTGLERGSPVKFRGVTIGVVREIRVGADKKHLAVEAALYDDYLLGLGFEPNRLDDASPLPENLRAMVVMSWVTGTAFIQVDFFPDPPAGPQRLPFPAPPNTLRTVPSTAKSLEDASRELLRDLPTMASATRELLRLLHDELEELNAPAVAAQLQRTLATLDQRLVQFDVAATVRAAEETLAAVRDLAAELRASVDAAQLPATAQALRESLGQVASASQAAATDVATLTGDLRQDLAQLRLALAAVERLAELLERDPGALLRGRAAPPRSPIEDRR